MNRNLYTIAIIILLFSCKSKNIKSDITDPVIKKLNSDYTIWKNEFSDSLIAHFPKQLDKDVISVGSSYRNEPKEFLYLSLEKKISKEEKIKFSKLKMSPDSCIIYIYSERIAYGFNKKGLGDCNEWFPVPEFDLISVRDTVPMDLVYYTLEQSHHKYIDNKLYLRYYLPEEWKNGMSRGVGISEKENIMFYWLIMW